MPDLDTIGRQKVLYGEPLGDIVRRIMERLGLTQGRVAQVLGLSAPMLSQLVSGQRVKIGNPAVVQRLQSLSSLAETRGELSAAAVEETLGAIRAEQATLSGRRVANEQVILGLRGMAQAAELTRLAALTHSPELAEVLRAAAQPEQG